jgi:predicted phosphoadenosine phosphosulfate sulfurtransferase
MLNVLEAAQERIRWVFDHYARVVVSVSGGKDSTVLHHLALEEAQRRGRKVEVFFLDQEAEYQGTIEQIDVMMRHPAAIPVWLQVPLRMTNATSHRAIWLNAWAPGEAWMRDRSPLAIAHLEGAPDRFYDIFPWLEKRATEPTAHLVGIRSRESLNRWRAVQANPGVPGINWSTKTEHPESFRFYPIFDWNTGDVWKYIADAGLRYNRVYDQMIALRGANQRTSRVSCLVHEQAYKALAQLQEIEPETYDRLLRRLEGVHCAALYAEDEHVFKADTLPAAFATWRAYRDYLMETTPLAEGKMARFRKRFAGQADDEATCREHVRQLLINDWENNVPVRRQSADRLRAAWWDRL